jgi:hypothetical protein
MTRDDARDTVLQAVDRERAWQASRFSTEHDDSTVHADLNHMVAVITKYLGELATQAVRQADCRDVDLERVAVSSVKVAAVATAIVESLVFTGRVSSDTIMSECHGCGPDAG